MLTQTVAPPTFRPPNAQSKSLSCVECEAAAAYTCCCIVVFVWSLSSCWYFLVPRGCPKIVTARFARVQHCQSVGNFATNPFGSATVERSTTNNSSSNNKNGSIKNNKHNNNKKSIATLSCRFIFNCLTLSQIAPEFSNCSSDAGSDSSRRSSNKRSDFDCGTRALVW